MEKFLESMVKILGASALSVFVLGRLRIPPIVGFLVAGVILGPAGLRWIDEPHLVEVLAEVGVILLMFALGLEFSLSRLVMLRRAVFGVGSLQVGLTAAAVALLARFAAAQPWPLAVFLGFMAALSSTAIVVKLLMDRGEIDSPRGRNALGILIFQDLIVVPFILLIPLLAGHEASVGGFALALLKSVLVLALILGMARWAMPRLLHAVAASRSRELFLFTVILICIGAAYITARLGLSLALGAFLAGILISDSEYAAQAVAEVLPFKEVFIGIFFISIGLLLDVRFFWGNLAVVGATLLGVLLLKAVLAILAGLGAGLALPISLQSGILVAQVGEFAFVLATAGRGAGLLPDGIYQLFLAAAIGSMLLTPLLAGVAGPLSQAVSERFCRRVRPGLGEADQAVAESLSDHLIIIGFGVVGRNLARVLRGAAIPYVVLELNSHTVRRMRKEGEPIVFGDGTRGEILEHLGVRQARVLVVAIADAAATRRIVRQARGFSPRLRLLVRTHFLAEVEDLHRLGADEVIPEEFETAVEIFARVLHHFHVPVNRIQAELEAVRAGDYRSLRRPARPDVAPPASAGWLQEVDAESVELEPDHSATGRTVAELHLRAVTGATLVAVLRDGRTHPSPGADFSLRAGDRLWLIGRRDDLHRAMALLLTGSTGEGREPAREGEEGRETAPGSPGAGQVETT
jgi:CPA2 family monovalent cation:H+ antiporter-2